MIDISTWGWPQWVSLALYGLMLVTHIVLHGKPGPNFNGPLYFISGSISLFILAWGGFFK
jgi:hypothetical protein